MSYVDIENNDFYRDINHRKEFVENIVSNTKDNYDIDEVLRKDNKLILNNYQRFITNFINPNTKFDKLLLVHSTGVGKTITSLSTAMNFIKTSAPHKVYIIGFSKSIFKRELFTRPEFGIVSKKEIKEMTQLRRDILKHNNDRDKSKLKELKKKYTTRLRNGKGSGFFEFIGYKMLLDKLIVKIDINYELNIYSIKSEKELNIYLEKNVIKINNAFLESIDMSLLICDEIHNVYNSLNINNWGFCLKYILKYTKSRALFLSATPINNKPDEIVSILELLNTDQTFNKSDIFTNGVISKEGKDIIIKGIKDKISYLKDMNLELYPSKIIHGESIPGIDYLKFIKCPMSDLHFKTYVELSKLKSNEVTAEDAESGDTISIDTEEIEEILDGLKEYKVILESDNRYLNDFVMPDPNSKLGLFKKNDLIKAINNATNVWKNKMGIDLIKKDKLLNNTITGHILEEKTINKYSTKFYNMLKIIRDCVENNKGKIFIYHNFVQMSGVNFISEVLKENGILNLETGNESGNTRCSICYVEKKKHSNSKLNPHNFKPMRYIMITGNVSKSIIDNQLEMFNLEGNKYGEEIKIILGSRSIKESYDLKTIQNLIVIHQPDNISTLIQIFGRAIRKGSHMSLPEDRRNVNIYMLVSSMPEYIQKKFRGYLYTFEEMKYKFKVDTYKIIQNINDMFIESAIDLNVNFSINYPDAAKNNTNDLYDIKKVSEHSLIKINYNNINLSTFQSYYYNDEINICKYIIKRLFIEYSKIWTYDDLLKNVRDPYFNMNFNTKMISEDSFIVALDFLVYEKSNINIIDESDMTYDVVNNLFDHNEKFLYDGKSKYIITYIDEYYMLIPFNTIFSNDDRYQNYNIYDNIEIDYDVVYRENLKTSNVKLININEYIETHHADDYDSIKEHFIEKYENKSIESMLDAIAEYDYDFHLHLIEDTIEYLFNLYTNKNSKESSDHDFYIKMLYFYNRFSIILFANRVDKDLNEIYKKYVIPTKNVSFVSSSDPDEKHNYNYNNLINSLEDDYDNKRTTHAKAVKLIDEFLEKKKNKIHDYLLPVGHVFGNKLKFLNPNGEWFIKERFNRINGKYKDNEYIIGYLEKSKIGFDIIFKLKMNNTSKKNVKDRRQIQTGLQCNNMDKEILRGVCKKMGIILGTKENKKKIMCDLIKSELIKLELEERRKDSRLRYFYYYWEFIETPDVE